MDGGELGLSSSTPRQARNTCRRLSTTVVFEGFRPTGVNFLPGKAVYLEVRHHACRMCRCFVPPDKVVLNESGATSPLE